MYCLLRKSRITLSLFAIFVCYLTLIYRIKKKVTLRNTHERRVLHRCRTSIPVKQSENVVVGKKVNLDERCPQKNKTIGTISKKKREHLV